MDDRGKDMQYARRKVTEATHEQILPEDRERQHLPNIQQGFKRRPVEHDEQEEKEDGDAA